MNFGNLAKLFTEFLDMFKGEKKNGFEDIISSLGNIEMLKNLLKNKYIKYLPLLPLLAKVSKEGFKGLLNNTDDIKRILSVFTQSEDSALNNINLEEVIKYLPQILEFFKKRESEKDQPLLLENKQYNKQKIENNPIACISDIADKDIIYALNKYISKNT